MTLRILDPLVPALLAAVPVFVYISYRSLKRSLKSRRRLLPLIARSAVFVLIVLAIAGVQIAEDTDAVNVIYLIDDSESMSSGDERAIVEFIRTSSSSMGGADTASAVVFGADRSVEIEPTTELELEGYESIVDGSATDIEGAILGAISIFPESGAKRIVLLSDGNETSGSAEEAVRIAESLGVRIDTVALGGAYAGAPGGEFAADGIRNEVAVADLIAPESVRTGQMHDITVLIEAREATVSDVYILRNGAFLGEDRLQLSAGENRMTYTTAVEEGGVHTYEVVIRPDEDTFIRNNEYRTSMRVEGEPSVLYVSSEGEESASFLNALDTQGIPSTRIGTEELPPTLAGLLPYDLVVFDNVPAYDLSFNRMETIERYVRDAAGGFLMLGGDESFGAGGYYNTPIERILPVDMDVTSSMDTPSLALIMVIDKSGSMGDTIAGGETKLDLVKEAVIASVEVLNPFYTVALLAFDADFEWTVEPVRAGRIEQIVADLRGLESGGGTRLYPAMEEGFARLDGMQAAVKHLLVLSDGLTDDGEFEQLAQTIRANRITVSTIAVGTDSDQELLETIAEIGGGRSYYTDDIKRIPRIFASESLIVSRGLIVEELFIPSARTPSEIIDGINTSNLPPLGGFVLTYPKDGATEVLSTFNDNPLLAVKQHGLGRTAAFTSDLKGAWGREWIGWDEFPRFSAQLVRWLQRPPAEGPLDVTVSIARGVGEVRVEGVDENGDFVNNLDLMAIVLSGDGSTEEIEIPQTAPGLYEGELIAREEGDYFITIYGNAPGRSIGPRTYGASVPYSEEYLFRNPDLTLLERMARETGGSSIRPDTGESAGDYIFTSAEPSGAYIDIWPYLLIAALVLFTGDIALRQAAKRREEAAEAQPVSRRGARPRGPTYHELIEQIESEERRENRQKRTLSYWFGPGERETDASARLYLSRRNRR